jgi:cytosine/adenosine deaminase-related metal-dependent hydrolase
MLITAGWVLPISRRPIRNGGVIVERGHVLEVAEAEELIGMPGTDVRHDFPDGILLPGLVNSHTHLSLAAMEGLFEPDAFDHWLPPLADAMAAWGPGDFAASATMGAQQCIEAGVTVVGDIAYGPESLAAAADAGIGGVFYWEVLGIEGKSLFAHLESIEFPVDSSDCGERVRCGLSPHSPYTSGPGLISAIHETAQEIGAPVAIHIAESAQEAELLTKGTGPLAEIAKRMIKDFRAPGVSGVTYLDRLDALDGITAVHLGYSLPTDIPRLAATVRGVVVCPRSSRHLSSTLPRFDRMLKAGVPIGIGTDCAAAIDRLDLFEEARALKAQSPRVADKTLLEMMTSMGAIALGVEERFGILECGMHADMAVFKIGATDSPESDLIRLGGRKTLEAVMSAGEWRVLDGKPRNKPTAKNASAVKNATQRAKKAIGRE